MQKFRVDLKTFLGLASVPALRVGKVGSRLGPQDLEGPKMPKVGPQAYWQFDTCSYWRRPATTSRAK